MEWSKQVSAVSNPKPLSRAIYAGYCKANFVLSLRESQSKRVKNYNCQAAGQQISLLLVLGHQESG
jgi:hypothetical protein